MYSIDENDAHILVAVEAEDQGLPETLSYSVDPVFEDGALFSIHPVAGELQLNLVTDYENPIDNGLNNSYTVRVLVTDGMNVTAQDIVFNVQPLNDNAQVITTPKNHDVDEGDTYVTQVEFTDDDIDTPLTITFSLLNGVGDSDEFTIDPL